MKSTVIIFILIISATLVFCDRKKIAIIGGGIGGTSCAKFLNDLVGDVEIDLYESKKIGGRLSGITHKGHYYEIGGSMMININYVSDLVKKFQLKTKEIKDKFSIYENKKLNRLGSLQAVFETPSFYKASTSIFIPIENEFTSIYSRQKDYRNIQGARTFSNAYEMFSALDQKKVFQVKRSLLKIMETIEVSNTVKSGYAMAPRKQYGENLNIPPVVGYVSILEYLKMNKKFSILDGNQQLAEKCLEASGANLISKKIIGLTSPSKGSNKSNVIWMENGKTVVYEKEYDFVVFAIPLAENLQTFTFTTLLSRQIEVMNGKKFAQRVITILEGKVKPDYFNLKLKASKKGSDKKGSDKKGSDKKGGSNKKGSESKPFLTEPSDKRGSDKKGSDSDVPKAIVFFDHDYIDYILKLDGTDIWKIQSKRILTKQERSLIFEEKSVIIEKEWLAYPDYKSHRLDHSDQFVLANNVLYLNSIEWAGSSIEMSIISAKNAAIAISKAIFLGVPITH